MNTIADMIKLTYTNKNINPFGTKRKNLDINGTKLIKILFMLIFLRFVPFLLIFTSIYVIFQIMILIGD